MHLIRQVAVSFLSVVIPVTAEAAPSHWCEVGFKTADFGSWDSRPRTPTDVTNLWLGGPADVWAVGRHGAAHWDGTSWKTFPDDYPIEGVWSSGPNDAWLVGGGKYGLYHWNGSALAAVPETREVSYDAVWGTSPHDVWVVGRKGALHWNGEAWTEHRDIYGYLVRGTAENNLWLLDANQQLKHWDGNTWSAPFTARTADLIAGPSAGELWAYVGSRYHRPRLVSQWQKMPKPPRELGSVSRWNGRKWSAQMPLIGLRPGGALLSMWSGRAQELWGIEYDEDEGEYELVCWRAAHRVTVERTTGSVIAGRVLSDGGIDLWIGGAEGSVLHRRQEGCEAVLESASTPVAE